VVCDGTVLIRGSIVLSAVWVRCVRHWEFGGGDQKALIWVVIWGALLSVDEYLVQWRVKLPPLLGARGSWEHT
jgi:hypothetical protein